MTKKTYMPQDIYIGNVIYNTGSNGYYHTSTEAFVKRIDSESSTIYESIKAGRKYKEYTKNTSEYLTVGNLLCMTNLIPMDKQEQPISENIINLYLLKYKLKSLLKKEQPIVEKAKVKNN